VVLNIGGAQNELAFAAAYNDGFMRVMELGAFKGPACE